MEALYKHSSIIHNTRAAEIVVPIILDFVQEHTSVLDVGCGTGTWLNVLRTKFKIDDVVGLDGDYVERSQLMIPDNKFLVHDLRDPFRLHRRFDILLCLEVAEHLPEQSADSLIESLCIHSRVVIFSAAIPWQGGQNHLNEQWHEYWRIKFEQRGYQRLDIIRPLIWNEEEVNVWYRQNIYVFTDDAVLMEQCVERTVNAEIHPELWQQRMLDMQRMQNEINNFENGGAGVYRSFRAFANALINLLKK